MPKPGALQTGFSLMIQNQFGRVTGVSGLRLEAYLSCSRGFGCGMLKCFGSFSSLN